MYNSAIVNYALMVSSSISTSILLSILDTVLQLAWFLTLMLFITIPSLSLSTSASTEMVPNCSKNMLLDNTLQRIYKFLALALLQELLKKWLKP
jgi:hypothetical protein